MISIEQILKNNHLKITPVRICLLALFEKCKPLSAMEILAGIKSLGFEPNKTTIYREIETLQKAGLIQPMSLDGKNTVYELCAHHHHHLVCVNCKSIKSVPCKNDCRENFSSDIQNNEFKIINSSVNIFGYCATCKEGK